MWGGGASGQPVVSSRDPGKGSAASFEASHRSGPDQARGWYSLGFRFSENKGPPPQAEQLYLRQVQKETKKSMPVLTCRGHLPEPRLAHSVGVS